MNRSSLSRCLRQWFLFLVGGWGLSCVAIGAAASPGQEPLSPAELFDRGNQAFLLGNFAEASSAYQQIIKTGEASAGVHYNLANAYYRQGAFGQAIFHLRAAHRLSPRDPDIAYNLTFVRHQASDKIEASSPGIAARLGEYLPYNLRELVYFLLAVVIFSSLCSLALLYATSPLLLYSRRVFVFLSVCALIATAVHWQSLDDFGVISASQAGVYSGQGEGNVLLFNLHQGAEFTLKDHSENWLRIMLADGKQGWVNSRQAETSLRANR